MNPILPSSRPAFKKGDTVYIVVIGHEHGHSRTHEGIAPELIGWDVSSEGFQSKVYAEKVTLTSLGRRQGTATTVKGNLLRRIYTDHTVLVRTEAEVEAIRAAIGTEIARQSIERAKVANVRWAEEQAVTGHPLGFRRNKFQAERLAACVALEPVIVWK